MSRILAILLLLTSAARAGQIDYLVQCATEAVCISDAVAGGFYDQASGQWQGATVIPNVRVNNVSTGPISGWWAIVSTNGRNATIEGAAVTKLALDRDLANAGKPASQWVLINRTGLTLANIAANYCISPLFLGAAYPVDCAGQ